MNPTLPDETCRTAGEKTPLPLRELAFPAIQSARPLAPPSTIAEPANPMSADAATFKTVALFQVRRIRNPVALEFALAQAWSLLDARQYPLPALPADVTSFVPCKLLITMRHHLTTDERIGRIQFVRTDGSFFHDSSWVIRIPRRPAP